MLTHVTSGRFRADESKFPPTIVKLRAQGLNSFPRLWRHFKHIGWSPQPGSTQRLSSRWQDRGPTMDAFISRKKRKMSHPVEPDDPSQMPELSDIEGAEDSTDLKLAILSSLYPEANQETLLDALIAAEGSVQAASQVLNVLNRSEQSPVKAPMIRGIGYQTSLSAYKIQRSLASGVSQAKGTSLTKKGQTLHLYDPVDIASHTPCSIIHNFLPPQEANDLLKELLEEAATFGKQVFKLFDNVVTSPHSACFYVESLEEQKRQETEYLYNGSFLTVGSHMEERHNKYED